MTTQKITLELIQEQKDAVLPFINFNNWNVNVEENERSEEGKFFDAKTQLMNYFRKFQLLDRC